MDNTIYTSQMITLEDMVYENRNKAYGSYVLRKKYRKYLLLAFIFSLFTFSVAVGVPFIKAYMYKDKGVVVIKETKAVLEKVIQDEDEPPPPPPPPPPAPVNQIKYTAPVVVEEEEEVVDLATTDEVNKEVVNEPPPTELIERVEEAPEVEKVEEIILFVEEPAQFMGGDINTFREWVANNMVYPPMAAEAGLTGKVIVYFCVNSKGKVVDVKIAKSVDPLLDDEALRVIKSSPNWTPAKQGGKNCKVQYYFPLSFTLSGQ